MLPIPKDDLYAKDKIMKRMNEHESLSFYKFNYLVTTFCIPTFFHYIVFIIAFCAETSETRIYEYLCIYVPMTAPFMMFGFVYLFSLAGKLFLFAENKTISD